MFKKYSPYVFCFSIKVFDYINSEASNNSNSSQMNLRFNELNYQDFEQFKKQYETENNLNSQILNIFNEINNIDDVSCNDNESFDYLFDRKIVQQTETLKQNNDFSNKFSNNEPPKNFVVFTKPNSFNNTG